MIGPGKYDALCTQAREQAGARACILIILGGRHGHGFSVQTTDPAVAGELPKILRKLADDMERDIAIENT